MLTAEMKEKKQKLRLAQSTAYCRWPLPKIIMHNIV